MNMRTLGLMLATTLLLAACSKPPEETFATVTVKGNVSLTAGPMPEGTLHFRLYTLEALNGELQHPLQEIEDFESSTAAYSHTFEYPVERGTGLAVHAWLDTDGDGIFCTPLARLDPSGLSWIEESPQDEVTLDITLSKNCRAANYFYPTVPAVITP
jgi:hypothetical protein